MPRAPGGGTDTWSAWWQPGLEKKFGVSILVDNRPDAAAVMGATIVTKAKPDGYTFYASDNSFYQNPAILDSLPYDTLKDFTAVTMLAQGPVILLVHPDVPAKTLPELIALAKKTQLTYASGGIGASTHLVGVMVNLQAGTKITPRPVQGHGTRPDRAAGRPCHDAVRRHQLGGALRREASCGQSRSPAIIAIPSCRTSRPSRKAG